MPEIHKKIIFFSRVFIVLGIIFCIKLGWLQIIHGADYVRDADRQYITPKSQIFDRGTIYFSKKDGTQVSAATIKSGFKIAVNPKTLTDPNKLYEQLNPIVPIDRELFNKKISKKTDTYEEIATGLTEVEANQITALKRKDIQIYRQAVRLYPAGALASQVIGFMAYKKDTLSGQYGLERFYENVLVRMTDKSSMNFFVEVFLKIKSTFVDSKKTEGDIVITIEPALQQVLEQQLQIMKKQWDSEELGGIVMDSQTGAIYAMGVYPTFDPNDFSKQDPAVFKNPLVESVFEVGSIMKPIIMAVGLETKSITRNTLYTDTGSVQVKNRTIKNFDGRGRGTVNMQTVLDQSLNTGMVFLMQRLDRTVFKQYFTHFGFTEKTGIDLPGEVRGLTNNVATGGDVEFANIAFGQGVAVTPISMITALNALGNRGILVRPHVLEHIEYDDGLVDRPDYTVFNKQVISPDTSDLISEMLVHVFDSYANGGYKMNRYSIAGKTGTAQIANPAGGYYDDRNLHSFFGYFPAHNPRFIVYLYNKYPKNGARFASETTIDPFLEITKFLINYYNIAPDR